MCRGGHPISNVMALNFTRNLTIACDVAVKVHSWNSQRKSGLTESFPKASKSIQPGQASAKTRAKHLPADHRARDAPGCAAARRKHAGLQYTDQSERY